MSERHNPDAQPLAASVAALIRNEYRNEGSRRVPLVSLDEVLRRPRRAWKWAVVLPVPVLAAALALLYVQMKPLSLAVTGAHLSAAREVVADGSHEPDLRFSDGTEVALSPSTQAQIQTITAHGATVVLRRGRATANVVHRSRARWYFVAGPYQIDVVGTKFSVEWQPNTQRLWLHMHNGKVRVTGPLVPEGTFLTQGQRLLVNVQTAELRINGPADAVAQEAPVHALVVEPSVAPKAASPTPRKVERSAKIEPRVQTHISQLVSQGAYAQALVDMQGERLTTFLAQAPSSELSALAEAARYQQNVDVARASLMAQRKRFPHSRAGAEAAFHLGRLAEDVDNMPSRAASWFELYLQDQPTGRFASECLGRQMVAVSRMGDRAGARQLAAQYVQRFPQGTYATVARQLSEGPR